MTCILISNYLIEGFFETYSVDTGELTEEDHDVGVDSSTTSARIGEELGPGQERVDLDLISTLLSDRVAHLEKFGLGLQISEATDALPDSERLNRATLVHEETGRLRQEDHADEEDGGEDDRGSEDVAPVALDVDEDGGNDVAEDFTKSNVELVQGDEVTSPLARNGLGDVDGNGTTETELSVCNAKICSFSMTYPSRPTPAPRIRRPASIMP